MSLKEDYSYRHKNVLQRLASNIEANIRECLTDVERIDRIAARAKSIDRFLAKAQKEDGGKHKYDDPLRQIQDQVGARIITFYQSDVVAVSQIIERYFRHVETRSLVPESEWEFGYFGKHYILFIPTDVWDEDMDPGHRPEFFELQIKTLFQHAWSEAEHDLGYKPGKRPLSADEKRRLAYTAAQAWGADRMFSELFDQRSSD